MVPIIAGQSQMFGPMVPYISTSKHLKTYFLSILSNLVGKQKDPQCCCMAGQRSPNKVDNIETTLGQHRHDIYNIGPIPVYDIYTTLAQQCTTFKQRWGQQYNIYTTLNGEYKCRANIVCHRWPLQG